MSEANSSSPSREAMALVKSLLWAMGNLDDASAADAALALDAAIRAGAREAVTEMVPLAVEYERINRVPAEPAPAARTCPMCGDTGIAPRCTRADCPGFDVPAPAATCACGGAPSFCTVHSETECWYFDSYGNKTTVFKSVQHAATPASDTAPADCPTCGSGMPGIVGKGCRDAWHGGWASEDTQPAPDAGCACGKGHTLCTDRCRCSCHARTAPDAGREEFRIALINYGGACYRHDTELMDATRAALRADRDALASDLAAAREAIAKHHRCNVELSVDNHDTFEALLPKLKYQGEGDTGSWLERIAVLKADLATERQRAEQAEAALAGIRERVKTYFNDRPEMEKWINDGAARTPEAK